jgi:hypothetical protein
VANPDGDLDVFGGLERLIEQSLLRQEDGPDGEPRFTMLETVREFGLERIVESGEADGTRKRHAAFFLGLVAEATPALMIGQLADGWLDRLEAEHDNLRAALGWGLERDAELALRLADGARWFWWIRGYLREGLAWIERALAVGVDSPMNLRAMALAGAGAMAQTLGELARAEDLQTRALALAHACGDAVGLTRTQMFLASTVCDRGDAHRAQLLFENALSAARALDDPRWLAIVLENYGESAVEWGDHDRATALLEEGVALARALGPSGLLGAYLGTLGSMRLACADVTAAAAAFREGLALSWEARDWATFPIALVNLATVAAANGQSERSAWWLGVADKVREETGAHYDPIPQAAYERVAASGRKALGEAAFTIAYETCLALSREEAIEEALAQADKLMSTSNG